MAFKTPILIFCRVKPSSNSVDDIQEYVIRPGHGSSKDTLIIANYQSVNFVNHKPDSYRFQFMKVFDQDASQDQIYNAVAKPVVDSALKGYNGTIFAYGQTGSGKTHTISGDKDDPGVVPRALCDIFHAIENTEGERFDVQMSYLEIYNEQSNDLLISTGEEKKKISLREGGDKVLEWHNLSMSPVKTFSEALGLLTIGDNNRIVGDTPMNIYSSRSHTILTIYLTAHLQDSLEIRRAKLNLVDLAGSERVHKTGEEGIVLEEARHINLSLHYLEQVIVALSDPGRSHVPYRNCTLTAALRDSLGGNCMTVMVANVAVNKSNVEETVSTCRFAQRVSLVRNEVTVNMERDLTGENNQLKAELHLLRGQCSTLRAKVQELEKKCSTRESVGSHERVVTSQLSSNDSIHVQQTQLSSNDSVQVQQLKTDIIYMIDWLQEMKSKHSSVNVDCELSSFSVMNTVEPDEGFDDFVTSMKAKEDWTKAREMEKTAVEALATKLDAIDSVHQEILTWWKENEKSLVREMLNGRVINVPGSEAGIVTSSSSLTSLHANVSIDNLLYNHSELLKDFQLLKSRLQSSKRNLQRIKRKYLVEFTNWKKDKVSSENLFEKLGGPGDFMDYENIQNTDNLENDRSKNCTGMGDMENKYENHNFKTYFTNKNSNNRKHSSYWSEQEVKCDNSFLLNESDLSSVLGDMNSSVFSTSTLLSDSRVTLASEPRACKEPRLVRSVPTALHTATPLDRSCYADITPKSLHLTGDREIDEEIIAFYQNKRLN